MKVLISGCSHSVRDYEAINGNGYFDLFANHSGLELQLLAEKGISNENILERIYNVIYTQSDIDTIIVQFTYLHRMSFWFNVVKDYIHFQPSLAFNSFEIESWWTEKQLKKKFNNIEDAKYYSFDKDVITKALTDFYQYYLVYGFDEEKEKQKIQIQLKILKDICKQKRIKLITLWFDETELEDETIVKVDGYTSIHKWQIDNKLFIGNKQFHLNKQGHLQLEKQILNKWQSIQR